MGVLAVRCFCIASMSLWCAGFVLPVRADEPLPAAEPNTIVTLAPVEVAGKRSAEEQLRLDPGFARAYDVSGDRVRPGTVSDVLAGAVGIHIRQFGGVGGFSTASIRGSSSGQVALYLDGVPLNSAQYGVVNLGDFPLAPLDRIDVFRGAAPLGLDSPGGGVINLIGRRADGTWLGGSAGHGSFATSEMRVEGGWRRGTRSALAIAQYLRSNGDFPYLDDNGTPFNASDDTVHARQNDRLESLSLTGRLEQGIGPVGLALVHDHFSKRQGTPGAGSSPALHADLRTERSITNLLVHRAATDPPGRAPAIVDPRLRVYLVEQRDRFSDPNGELTGVRQQDDDRTRRAGAEVGSGLELIRGQVLRLGGEFREERYAPSILGPTPRTLPRSERRFLMFGAEQRSSLLGGHAALIGSLRRQVTDDDFPGGPPYPGALPAPANRRTIWLTSWTVGARLDLVGGVAAKGSYSRLARMPTLEELFGNRAGIYGNPRTKPESVDTRDAGLIGEWSIGGGSSFIRPARLETQLSAYRSQATDLILFIQNSQRSSVAQNISAARLAGVEWSLRAGWSTGMSADLSWTRQWTRDEGAIVYWRGKELPGRPRDEAAARLSGSFRRWRAFYELHFISANFLDRYNQTQAPARGLHDIGLAGSPWIPRIEWNAECRNLTDQRVEDFEAYPLPGRMFYLGMRVRLDRKERAS